MAIKISLIIRNYTTKDGKRKFTAAKARGEYLAALGLETNEATNYHVKFTQKSKVVLPTIEGIYDCSIIEEHEDSDYGPMKAWIDLRDEFKDNPVIRIDVDAPNQVTFEKKCDLHTIYNDSAKAVYDLKPMTVDETAKAE